MRFLTRGSTVLVRITIVKVQVGFRDIRGISVTLKLAGEKKPHLRSHIDDDKKQGPVVYEGRVATRRVFSSSSIHRTKKRPDSLFLIGCLESILRPPHFPLVIFKSNQGPLLFFFPRTFFFICCLVHTPQLIQPLIIQTRR